MSITTSVSILAIEFDFPSELHGQVSLAYDVMDGCKNLKIH